MRLCSIACLVAISPSLASCAAEMSEPSAVLEEAQADEPALFLVTAQPEADFAACVDAADAIDGVDLVLQLPLIFKFVASAAVPPVDAARALLALECVQTTEFDAVIEEQEQLCTDFAASYCNKIFDCLSPAELAERGWTDISECNVQWQQLSCTLLDSCAVVNVEGAAECNAEITTGTCALLRQSLGSTPLVYPACAAVCVN